MHYLSFVLALLLSACVGCGPATETVPPAGDTAAKSPADAPNGSESETVASPAEASEAAVVQADAHKLQDAFIKGDGATFITFTYPEILEEMGGAEQAKADVDDAMSKMQAAGMAIDSMTFPEAPTFFSSPTHDFVFVPTLTIFAFKDQRIESLNFLLGVKPHGAAKWTYVDGSQVNAENTAKWFPDFPPGQTLPKTYKKISP